MVREGPVAQISSPQSPLAAPQVCPCVLIISRTSECSCEAAGTTFPLQRMVCSELTPREYAVQRRVNAAVVRLEAASSASAVAFGAPSAPAQRSPGPPPATTLSDLKTVLVNHGAHTLVARGSFQPDPCHTPQAIEQGPCCAVPHAGQIRPRHPGNLCSRHACWRWRCCGNARARHAARCHGQVQVRVRPSAGSDNRSRHGPCAACLHALPTRSIVPAAQAFCCPAGLASGSTQ